MLPSGLQGPAISGKIWKIQLSWKHFQINRNRKKLVKFSNL